MKRTVLLVALIMVVGEVRAEVLTGPIANPANGHNYYLLEPIPWTAAGFATSEAEAVHLGGHLATINDAAEDRWVFSTFAPFVPTGIGVLGIGMNDLAVEGHYVYTSSEPATYFNWDPNWHGPIGPQPDGELDDVVGIAVGIFTPGKWHDFYTSGDLIPPSDVCALVETVASPEPSSLAVGGVAIALLLLGKRLFS